MGKYIEQNNKENKMRIKNLIIFGLFSLLAFKANAIQILNHIEKNKTANQWEVIDIQFKTKNLPAKPEDTSFSAELSHVGSSDTITVSGFYNGDKSYLVRFCPDIAGVWNYHTKSDVKDLNGLKGQIIVNSPLEGRKGGIKINPKSTREFIYSNGNPYFPICFEVDWLFALDAENPNDIPVTRKFVNTIAENGFNQLIMNVFAYDVGWAKDSSLKAEHNYGSPKVFPFAGNNKAPDHSKLNIEYFRRLDRVIDYLDKKGVAAHVMIYVWNKEVNWPKADSEEDNRYFDYVVKRYQAYPNMVWDISKEALGYGREDASYITRRVERLRQLDAHKRLVTVHDWGYCKKHMNILDFASVQIWDSELTRLMLKFRDEIPNQPILNIEHGGYEKSPYVVFPGNYDNPEVCLERAYNCVFAGTFPTHYWQGAAWYAVIPDIDALAPEDRPKLEYYKYMSGLVSKYKLGTLKASDNKGNGGFCLHNDNDLFIYCLPREINSVTTFLPVKHIGKTCKFSWFDPYTGIYSESATKKINSIHTKFYKPKNNGFGILIVEIS